MNGDWHTVPPAQPIPPHWANSGTVPVGDDTGGEVGEVIGAVVGEVVGDPPTGVVGSPAGVVGFPPKVP